MSEDHGRSNSAGGGEKDLRVFFAGQRTMLAWVRTGVSLMGFGFVVAKFGMFVREMGEMRGLDEPSRGVVSLWAGTALLAVGVAVNVVAAVRYARFARAFNSDAAPQPTGIKPEITLAVVLASLGVMMAVYLTVVG